MAVQTSYTETADIAYAGMVANMEPHTIVSRAVEAAAITFGQPVERGTADAGCIKGAGSSPFLGVAVADPAQPVGTPGVYAVASVAGVMTKGVIWVTAKGAVDAGDPVTYDSTSGWTSDTTNDTAVTGAVYDTTAGAGALVKIRLG